MRQSRCPARRGGNGRKAPSGREGGSLRSGSLAQAPGSCRAGMTDGPGGEVSVPGAVVCLAEAGGWGAFCALARPMTEARGPGPRQQPDFILVTDDGKARP